MSHEKHDIATDQVLLAIELSELRRTKMTRGVDAGGNSVWGTASRSGETPFDAEDDNREAPDPEDWIDL